MVTTSISWQSQTGSEDAEQHVRQHLVWNQPQHGQSSERDMNSVAYLQIYRFSEPLYVTALELAALPGNANIKFFWPVLWVPASSPGESDSFRKFVCIFCQRASNAAPMLANSFGKTLICVIYSQQNRLDVALNQEDAHSVTFVGRNRSVFTKDSETCLHLKL